MISDKEFLLLYNEYSSKNPEFAVGQNLFRSLIWLLVLFGLGLSIVF